MIADDLPAEPQQIGIAAKERKGRKETVGDEGPRRVRPVLLGIFPLI